MWPPPAWGSVFLSVLATAPPEWRWLLGRAWGYPCVLVPEPPS
jgi:hypothetical protein